MSRKPMDPQTVDPKVGSNYPKPFDDPCAEREVRKLGDLFGLTQFGANLVTLPPGTWASQRHWHEKEDEFVYIVSGEATQISDAGDAVLTAGMVVGYPAGEADGHHLVNFSSEPVVFLVVGSRAPDEKAHYSDLDMQVEVRDGKNVFTRRDGTPYDT